MICLWPVDGKLIIYLSVGNKTFLELDLIQKTSQEVAVIPEYTEELILPAYQSIIDGYALEFYNLFFFKFIIFQPSEDHKREVFFRREDWVEYCTSGDGKILISQRVINTSFAEWKN